MEQWVLRITSFAEALWNGLDELPGWSPRALAVQRSWIGRSEGTEIDFPVKGLADPIAVYTTRPDTVYGVTSVTIAPEYPRLLEIVTAERRDKVEAYVRQAMLKSELDRQTDSAKRGVFTGAYVTHPLTGAEVPVWVSDYVLGSYGTGAIMNVPAHDQRDFDFAVQQKLPIVEVIVPSGQEPSAGHAEAFTEAGIMVNSGLFTGRPSDEAKREITDLLEEKGVGRRAIRYRLRDWFIGRQRFWGAPIPMLRDSDGEWEPVPDADLPVLLPTDIDFSVSPGRSQHGIAHHRQARGARVRHDGHVRLLVLVRVAFPGRPQ
jgi:leucyl-tRNA synthetase